MLLSCMWVFLLFVEGGISMNDILRLFSEVVFHSAVMWFVFGGEDISHFFVHMISMIVWTKIERFF